MLTAEEFARLPNPEDDSLQELLNGVVVSTPPPPALHGACCATVALILHRFLQDCDLGCVFLNNTGFILNRNPDTVRAADLAFWSHDRLTEISATEYFAVVPDLAIEVLAKDDRPLAVLAKVAAFQGAGVSLIWVIDSIDRAVGVYRLGRAAQILTENDTLDGEGVLPGFTLPVRDLFS